MITGDIKHLEDYKKQLPTFIYECLKEVAAFDFTAVPDGKYKINGCDMDDVVAQTKVGGATLTGLLGTSAWIAPGAAAAALVEAIAMDEKKLIPCCVSLEGEYGEKDLCIGVPVVLGAKGVEKVVELKLAGEEKEKFEASLPNVQRLSLAS